MSSSPFSSASGQRSKGTVRVISRRSQSGSASLSDLDRLLEMAAVRVHRAEDHVVLEHQLVVERADVHAEGALDDATPVRHTIAPGAVCCIAPATSSATPVHSTTTSGSTSFDTSVMSPEWYAGAERVHDLRLDALGGAVEDVHLEAALGAHQRREQADRARRRSRARTGAPSTPGR